MANTNQASIKLKSFHWKGHSSAGCATSFYIPEYKWIFDCGARLVSWTPTCIFLTHTHTDHIQALLELLFRRNNSNKSSSKAITTNVYLLHSEMENLKGLLTAYHKLTRDTDKEQEENAPNAPQPDENETFDTIQEMFGFVLCPVHFNEEYSWRKGSDTFCIRTIRCHHRKPCVGYSIHRHTRVLGPQYVGLPGRELAQLAKSSAQLRVDGPLQPVICFLGDTTHKVFEWHPELLRQHEYIAVECTYYQDKDLQRADRNTHMHWKRLQPIVASHANVLFLLQHFSLKHSDNEWMEWMQSYNKESKTGNVHSMLNGVKEIPCECRLCFTTVEKSDDS